MHDGDDAAYANARCAGWDGQHTVHMRACRIEVKLTAVEINEHMLDAGPYLGAGCPSPYISAN